MTRELCIMACVFCKDPQFQEWAARRARTERYLFADCDMRNNSEMLAKIFILATCIIESRNVLDTSPEAAKRFHDLVRKPFIEWRDSQ